MACKSNGKAKLKWVRKELSRRTKGKGLSRQECSETMQEVWDEAHEKFGR